VVLEAMSRSAIVRLVENPGNRGKGYSVRNGMLAARGDVLLFTDADLSAPITEAGKLFEALQNGADIAIGSRWLDSDTQTERQPLIRQISGRIFNFLLRMVVGVSQKDTQCGFKAFKRSAAQAIFPRQRITGWGFDPELLYIARKMKFRVAEVPVEWAHDARSKIRPLHDGTKIVMEAFKIRWNAVCGRYRDSHYPGTK
jgi:glycosyltransferase involved in cell wall biosynthesis